MHTIGWVRVSVAGTVLTVGLFGASANAALCRKCGDLMFVQSVGKCAECGGTTSSGSHKICGKCGDKFAQCEHCRTVVKPGAEGTTNSPAQGTVAERKFRGALTERAQERAKKLKAHADKFELWVAPVLRNVEKPFYSLTLTVADVPGDDRSNPFVQRVQIRKEQAVKIIEHLLFEGSLERATEWDTRRSYDRVAAEGYTLIARGIPDISLEEGLGWDLAMLRRLDGLRKVLDGDSAKAMDLLLGRMSGLREEWQKKVAAAARENAESGVKGDPADGAGGTVVFDTVSGMTVTYSVEGQGQTAIIASDSRGRMIWKALPPKAVQSLRIEGRTVIAMPGGMQYDLATGKLLAITGR